MQPNTTTFGALPTGSAFILAADNDYYFKPQPVTPASGPAITATRLKDGQNASITDAAPVTKIAGTFDVG